jgi:adenylate cyclase
LADERVERRLVAVLAADVAGYSRLMGVDEEGTLAQLKAIRKALVDPTIAAHRGRIVKTTGDGMLVEFASAVDAARGAAEVQRGMAKQNTNVPKDLRIEFRIGIHVGDIIIDDNDIFGDGVNIAARLEGIAEPGGICVSDDAQRQIRGKIDLAFDDIGPQSLKNIPEPMRAWRLQIDKHSPSATHRKVATEIAQPLTLPDKPSIAVLPFQNMSGDPEQEYFADGMVEDIITALSRFKSLFVIARNSSFTYKGKSVGIKQVGAELGVRYVLEGSVRSGGKRVRVTAQLIDAETGAHLWAERYDRDQADLFAVQDDITEAVAIAVEPAVAHIEQLRTVRKPPESLGAWEAYQRGLWHVGGVSAEDCKAAKDFFRRAIGLDPQFASAHAWLAVAIFYEAALHQTSSLVEALHELLPIAAAALALDPQDAVAHFGMSSALFARGDMEEAVAEVSQALIINPNFADAHHLLGAALLYSDRPREGLKALHTSIRLDPCSISMYTRLVNLSAAHYFLRDYEAAVEVSKELLRSYPDHPWGLLFLAAALGQAGRLNEAEQTLQKYIAVAPKSFDMYVRQRVPWMRPEDHDLVLEGLRKAGWEG